MKSKPLGILAGVSLAVASLTAVAVPASASTPASVPGAQTATAPPWMNTRLSADQRARLVVAQMTLDEKIAMVHGAGFLFNQGFAGLVPANTRLGIPALYLADSPVGVGNGSTGVTQWADTSALASTWDTSLAHAYGSAYGAEQAGKGHNIALAPTINILRLPLWGRAPETFSEDPYLTGAQAVAEIRGMQGNHVIATDEALRREQPGGAAQPHQRRGCAAHAARDLSAGLQDGGPAGRHGRDHVLLQPGQRHLRVRERAGTDRRPA